MLGGQPFVFETLRKAGLLSPVNDVPGQAQLFDTFEIREAYVKARAKGLFHRKAA